MATRAVTARARRRVRGVLPRVLPATLALSLAAGALLMTVQADAARSQHARSARDQHHKRHRHKPRKASASAARPLQFGIYPGGAAGTVGPSGPLSPENPAKRLAALELLRPASGRFVLHLYAGYGGPTGASAAAQVGGEIDQYEAASFQIELVLCYRPSDGDPTVDVPGFAAFVRGAVERFGSNPNFISLQVTNEANVVGAPGASDGSYAGAEDALIVGVEAAEDELGRAGDHQVKVGFNWAYQLGSAEQSFWSYLGAHGGGAFRRALDWVGIDAYPGTWGPSLPSGVGLASGVRRSTRAALASLRNRYMPLAGIASSIPLHVSESGYPTGPGRSYGNQSAVLRAAVRAVSDYRSTYNVSDYRWFDLRDADTASASFEDQYGLLTDTYTAKPAFAVYRALVAAL